MNARLHDTGLLIMRLMTGVVFLFHGSQKLFGIFDGPGISGMQGYLESLNVPMPEISAWLAAGAEFLGGIALVLGVFQRLFSIPLTITMLVAAFTAHSGFSNQSGGMEYPLLLAFVAAGLGMTGPGRYAIQIQRRKAK